MPDRKNQDSILIFLKAIKGDVARATSGYDQLSQAMLDRPADQWMTDQQFNCFLDQSKRLRCRTRVGFDQEISEPFEVGERTPRVG